MKPLIIGICGPLGGGKSTLAKILAEEYGYERMRFAGILKDMCATLGLTQRQIDGDQKMVPDNGILCGKTPRWAMQSIGTEWGRKCIGENVWVNATMAKIERAKIGRRMTYHVVLDDVRFYNEVDAIKERNGILIRISGRDPESERASKGTWFERLKWRVFGGGPHPSELYWREFPVDHEIDNPPDATEGDLREALRNIMKGY